MTRTEYLVFFCAESRRTSSIGLDAAHSGTVQQHSNNLIVKYFRLNIVNQFTSNPFVLLQGKTSPVISFDTEVAYTIDYGAVQEGISCFFRLATGIKDCN
jgi:hypothetical protein